MTHFCWVERRTTVRISLLFRFNIIQTWTLLIMCSTRRTCRLFKRLLTSPSVQPAFCHTRSFSQPSWWPDECTETRGRSVGTRVSQSVVSTFEVRHNKNQQWRLQSSLPSFLVWTEISDSHLVALCTSCSSRMSDAYLSGSRCLKPWESECPDVAAHSITISTLPVYISCSVSSRWAEPKPEGGFTGRWEWIVWICFVSKILKKKREKKPKNSVLHAHFNNWIENVTTYNIWPYIVRKTLKKYI